MAKGPSSSDRTPDLFSRATRREETPLLGSSDHLVPELPHLLPKDLLGALRRLTDHEIKDLFSASNLEMRRRKLVADLTPVLSRMPASLKPQKEHRPSPAARALKTSDPLPVTQAKLNAIRVALKAGVKPNTVARQFGVTPAMLKKAVEDP